MSFNKELLNAFFKLGKESSEAVENGENLSVHSKYMKIERTIQKVIQKKMDEINSNGGGLLFLVGSAGDGKSHIMSLLKEKEEYNGFKYLNDATDYRVEDSNGINELKQQLGAFNNENIGNTTEKMVVNINLGVLIRFCRSSKDEFRELYGAAKPLCFNEGEPAETEKVKFVFFSDYQLYTLKLDENEELPVSSPFFERLLEKIAAQNTNNILFNSYKENLVTECPVSFNFTLLQSPLIRKAISDLVIEAIIRFNLYITPRDFLDFVYSIVVSPYLDERNSFRLEDTLPSLLFGKRDQYGNKLQYYISQIDPVSDCSVEHDRELSLLFTINDNPYNRAVPQYSKYYSNLEQYSIRGKSLHSFVEDVFDTIGSEHKVEKALFVYRLYCLENHIDTLLNSEQLERKTYNSFLRHLRGFYSNDDDAIQEIFDLVKHNVARHCGVYDNSSNMVPLANMGGDKCTFFAQVRFVESAVKNSFDIAYPEKFKPQFHLTWELPEGELYDMIVDYSMYEYLQALKRGRLVVITDKNKNSSALDVFIRKLESKSTAAKELIVHASDGNYKIVLEGWQKRINMTTSN